MASHIVVVDSGILLADLLPGEPLQLQARNILIHWKQNNFHLAAPALFHYELVAVMRRSVYQNRITPDKATQLLEQVLTFPVELHFEDTLLKRAFELATIHNRPTAYDSQYLAVAEKLGCEFWTADERLYNAVHPTLSWVKWLGHFSTP